MDNLIRTLPAILAACQNSEEVAEAACFAAWKHAVGEALSSHAVPVALQDKILIVAVADNVWQGQLRQMCGPLLSRLNFVLGQPIVKSIELRIEPARLANFRNPALAREPEQHNYDVPAELLSAAAQITDTDLRRAFLGAATSCVRRLELKS